MMRLESVGSGWRPVVTAEAELEEEDGRLCFPTSLSAFHIKRIDFSLEFVFQENTCLKKSDGSSCRSTHSTVVAGTGDGEIWLRSRCCRAPRA